MPRKSVSPRKKRPVRTSLAIHRHWLSRAEDIARRPPGHGGSPHPTVKVGAILVDRHGHEIAGAANRFAHGVDRKRPERYIDGVKSLWISCAEQIVIASALRARADIDGASLYLTLEPCAICAGFIAELRLREVFVPVGAMRRYAKLKDKWKTSIEVGLIKLAEAGVPLTAIDMGPPAKKRRRRNAR